MTYRKLNSIYYSSASNLARHVSHITLPPVARTPPVPDWVPTRQPQPFAPYPGNTPVDYTARILADNQRVLEQYQRQQQQARQPIDAQSAQPHSNYRPADLSTRASGTSVVATIPPTLQIRD